MLLCDDQWKHFQYFNLERDFLENENFFKKMENRFLVERTLKSAFKRLKKRNKIEKASFPYKTTISEANVKTSRMVATKWAYHRERNFTSNYFIFLKVLFQFKNLL